MILSTIQPSFLPWLGYFEQMARADLFVYLDDVQYTKQDWRNRNRFKATNGKIEYLTVPIRAEDSVAPINKVRIAEGPWAQKLVNRLEEWYRKAPAFADYFPAIREELLKGHELLSDLDVRLIDLLAKLMRIETPVEFSSALAAKSPDKNQKLIDICRHFGADILYDGAAAASFIDLDLFRANGIEVVFQNYRPVPYYQLGGGEFLNHLSALDTLFNCGERTRQIMLDGSHDGLSLGVARAQRSRVACPLCERSVWQPFLDTTLGQCLSGDRAILAQDLHKVICGSCGIVSNAAFGGEDTFLAYESSYQLNTTAGEEHIYFTKAGPVARSQAFLNWIDRHLDKTPSSILEVGCGQGNLLARMASRFPDIPVSGLEGSLRAVEIARQRGLNIHQGLVGKDGTKLPAADLVVNILVLEHIEEPIPYLEALRQACLPNGRAVFVVPLQDLGGYDLFFAEHVWHFFTEHFGALLQRAGWSVLTIDGTDSVIQGLGLAVCTPAGSGSSTQEEVPVYSTFAPAQQRNRDVWQHRFEEVDRRLKVLEGKPIIVFGSGEVFSLLLAYTALSRMKILACLDEDVSKIGTSVHGIAVYGLDWLKDAPTAPIFVTVNPRYEDAVRHKLAAYERPLVFWGDSW